MTPTIAVLLFLLLIFRWPKTAVAGLLRLVGVMLLGVSVELINLGQNGDAAMSIALALTLFVAASGASWVRRRLHGH